MTNTAAGLKVMVIGAGLAGSAAAIRLARRGFDVAWIEAAHFPRQKVCGCCLNLAALSALRELGCDDAVRRLAPAELRQWKLNACGREVTAPLPGGIAVSRGALDTTLVDEARKFGVTPQFGVRGQIVDASPAGVIVRRSDLATPQRFDAVVLATGLTGASVSRWLPWIEQPHGPMGASLLVQRLDGVADRTIHMVCGDGGYVGLVRLEDGRVDVAGAVWPERHEIESTGHHHPGGDAALEAVKRVGKERIVRIFETILATASIGPLPPDAAERLMTTPPLRRLRHYGEHGLLAVGDAAGYVEPFTGEGMAWAIRSGIVAADCIAAGGTPDEIADRWLARRQEFLRRRQWICRALARGLETPARSRWLVRGMSLAPWAVRRAVARLNRE
jgi:flavin-dependent dehydrogenase